MSVGRVAADNTILLASELSWMVAINETINLFLFHLHILLLLLNSHDEATICGQLILTL